MALRAPEDTLSKFYWGQNYWGNLETLWNMLFFQIVPVRENLLFLPNSLLGLAADLLLVILAASLAALAFAMSPGLARTVLKRFGISGEQRVTPKPGAVGFGLAATLAAWGAYGVALWGLSRGVLPSAHLPLPDAIGAFAGSYIAGLLFLLAPGGLGVREGVMLWMLEDRIGPANALVLAGVSRIGLTVADLLAVLPFVLTRAGERREPT